MNGTLFFRAYDGINGSELWSSNGSSAGTTIVKDIRILIRDKVGIAVMFGMPVLLVLIVTSIQNNTFQLINKNKISILICNRDTGKTSAEFIQAVDKIDMFKLEPVSKDEGEKQITERMHNKDVLLSLIISADFSTKID